MTFSSSSFMTNDLGESDLIANVSVFIHASAEKVWEALTDSDANREFMFGATVQSGWKEGDPITWKGEWKGRTFEDKGTILKAETYQLLQYTHFSPLSGKEDVPANYHVVTITITPEDGGVALNLSQNKNENPQAVQHSEKNWRAMLDSLKKYVEGR